MINFPNQDKVDQVPVQADHKNGWPESTIPLWLAEIAYAEYARNFSGQTLTRLNERGGFGRTELLKLLRDSLNKADL